MNHKVKKRPILLTILDGWGLGDENDANNAIAKADTPAYEELLNKYPYSKLETSGLAVGLPDGQIGNSEVGHMTIGAGRVIYQDLVRINSAIKNDDLAKDLILLSMVDELKKNSKAVHLVGLLSDGGVHCHQDHMAYLANIFIANGVKVYLHAFLDGRDVAQKSAIGFYDKFCKDIGGASKVELATVGGRYYAMDRDNKWDRVGPAYDTIVSGKSAHEKKYYVFSDLVNDAYKEGLTDEFIKPCAFGDYHGAKDGDALLFCNFRSDRARQISDALLEEDFQGFKREKTINFSHKVSMTKYSDSLALQYDSLFAPIEVKKSLPEILAANNMTQLRAAETEKFSHVTFFFSCGKEKEFADEKRILVPSPDVATYDLQPEMAASEVTKNLVEAIQSNEFDFIVVNYANPDMVGHSGNLQASIKACEAIDKELETLKNAILENDGVMFITADHGNIEVMADDHGNPHTAHTNNLVPFIMVANDVQSETLQDGNLSDIAPTILNVMGLAKPIEMTGKNLIK